MAATLDESHDRTLTGGAAPPFKGAPTRRIDLGFSC